MKSRNFIAVILYAFSMNMYYGLFFYSNVDWIYTKALQAAINAFALMWLMFDMNHLSDVKNRQSRMVLLSCLTVNTILCGLISLDVIMNGRLCLFVFNGLVFAISWSLLHNLNKYGYFK